MDRYLVYKHKAGVSFDLDFKYEWDGFKGNRTLKVGKDTFAVMDINESMAVVKVPDDVHCLGDLVAEIQNGNG